MRVPFQKAAFSALSTAAVVLAVSGGAFAQISLTSTTLGTSNVYAQNFSTLATSGTSTFVSGTTISNLFISETGANNLIADAGTDTTGSLHSYGTGTSTERAFGSIASGGTGTITYGFYFVNNDATANITSFSVAYTGEQWRNGGNATAQSLTFDYQVFSSATPPTGQAALAAGGYTAFSALNFTSPIATTTAGALNGNSAANRQVFTAQTITPTTAVANGQTVFVRFTDLNDAGNDHGLAIDDFTFTANYTPLETPEPGSFALLALGAGPATGLIALRRRAARRKKA